MLVANRGVNRVAGLLASCPGPVALVPVLIARCVGGAAIIAGLLAGLLAEVLALDTAVNRGVGRAAGLLHLAQRHQHCSSAVSRAASSAASRVGLVCRTITASRPGPLLLSAGLPAGQSAGSD